MGKLGSLINLCEGSEKTESDKEWEYGQGEEKVLNLARTSLELLYELRRNKSLKFIVKTGEELQDKVRTISQTIDGMSRAVSTPRNELSYKNYYSVRNKNLKRFLKDMEKLISDCRELSLETDECPDYYHSKLVDILEASKISNLASLRITM
ncbi:TPA: hypothetical protein ACH6AG_000065 [Campylobacter jejuni]